MISIEAHRASIGRFSGKAKYLSPTKSCQNLKGIDPALLLFLAMLLEVLLYGLIFMTMIICFSYIAALLMLTVAYGYSFWILKSCSELLSLTLQKVVKNAEVMRDPSRPEGIKVHPLIPCSYLDNIVLHGSCKFLDASALDGRDEETQHTNLNELKQRKLLTIVTKGIIMLCNAIICTMSINIIIELSTRANIVEHIHVAIDNLEFYSLSHLKLAQLLIDGDVESNPGPVTSNCETPKGRGRPKKASKFGNLTKRKLNLDNVDANNLYGNQIKLDTNNLYGNLNFFKKISVVKSDILDLRCDAIVNAAKMSLLGGGGIDGNVHRKAGAALSLKC